MSSVANSRWVHATGITCAISESGVLGAVAHALDRANALGVKVVLI
jgi:sugar/nucleoside kinase (ribokinase family)